MVTSPEDYLALWWQGEVRAPEAQLIGWARGQRLLPLLGWRAEAEGWQLPAALDQAIREARRSVAVAQVLIDHQLKQLGEIGRRLDIPIVLVKGAAAAQAYPKPWMRPFGDIDLLVAEQNVSGLVEALKKAGYTYSEVSEGSRSWHLPPLIPGHRGARIEIHTAMAREGGRALFTVEQWRAGLSPLTAYSGLHIPCPVDHVLYLIHHGVVHHGLLFGLQPYLDVGFWTSTWEPEDWRALRIETDSARMGNAVGLALGVTAWVWQRHLPIAETGFRSPPESLLARARETVAGTSASAVLPNVWRDIPPRTEGGLLRYMTLILLGDPQQLKELTLVERVRFHLLRPFKLIRNHGASMWRLLRGDRAARATWHQQRELQRWLREENV